MISRVTFALAAVAYLPCTLGFGEVISYEDGIQQLGYSGNIGTYYAVRFTNPYAESVEVDSVLIYGGHIVEGNAQVVVWNDGGSQPGTPRAIYENERLGPAEWTAYGISSLGLVLAPGEDLYAGYDPAGFNPWIRWAGDMPDMRSWWVNSSTGLWEIGRPPAHTNNHGDLMVRLEVTPESDPLPTQWVFDPLQPGDWSNHSHWDQGSPGMRTKALIDNGGTAVLNGTANAKRLVVGGDASGHLRQTGGSLSLLEKLVVGDQAGSSGTVQIAVGTLSAGPVAVIGNYGSGQVEVVGGELTSDELTIAHVRHSNGLLSVDGATSTVRVSDRLLVGEFGQGQLLVTGGGQVSSATGALGEENLLFGLSPTGTGVATITSGGQWTMSGDMTIGDQGGGQLWVDLAGIVECQNASVSYSGTSFARIQGADSLWTVRGSLNISNPIADGAVWVSSGGAVHVHGDTTLRNPGALLRVSGAESTFITDGRLRLHGAFHIEEGGFAQCGSALLGELYPKAVGEGTVEIDGAGSRWLVGQLTIGEGGIGRLHVTNGGSLQSLGLYGVNLGEHDTGDGTLSLTGTDSYADLGQLDVGYEGTGRLEVRDEAILDGHVAATIGRSAGAVGVATVSGGAWRLGANALEIGYAGQGSLTIQNQGRVECGDSRLASASTSHAVAIVEGADSAWLVDGHLFVGGDAVDAGGTATLDVSDEATLSVSDTLHIWDTGEVDVSGGLLSARSIVAQLSDGLLANDGWLEFAGFSGDLHNHGLVVQPFADHLNFTISGDYNQNAEAGIVAMILGRDVGQFSQLNVGGIVELSGRVIVTGPDGLLIRAGDRFDFLRADQVQGEFTGGIVADPLAHGLSWELAYAEDSVSLVVVPEPMSAEVMALFAVCLLLGRNSCTTRRHRQILQ